MNKTIERVEFLFDWSDLMISKEALIRELLLHKFSYDNGREVVYVNLASGHELPFDVAYEISNSTLKIIMMRYVG